MRRIVIVKLIICLFISGSELDRVVTSKINDNVISDHATVTCMLSPKENIMSPRIWRMNMKYLMDTDFLEYVNNHIDLFIEINVKSGDPQDRPGINIIWDTFKAYLRGVMIGYASKKKAEFERELDKVREEIQLFQRAHKTQTNSSNYKKLQEAKLKLDRLLFKKAEDFKHNCNRINDIAANKSGKHFTSLIKKVLKRKPIVLRDVNSNKVHTNNQAINNEFRSFYEELYTSEIKDQDALPFLKSINLKSLSPEQIEDLSKDITNIEIQSAIKNFSPKKAPGMDDFPIEFYTTFWAKIDSLFTEVVNLVPKNNSLPETMYQAIISVIPKPEKTCEVPSDYRPISLINCDKKIITKILNNRLVQILPSLIHYDQAGFIQHRDLRTNTRTCISLTQYAKKHQIDLTLMTVDAEKAFDRLEWSYLFKVLEVYNFPLNFMNMIGTLYKSPKAYTNGILSKPFLLTRGTAQGCPLSPSLFALAIEPLAQKIRETKEIGGIEIGKKRFKLSLFADDLLLYLSNAVTSVPHVMEIITTFSRILGYKMNIAKTELLAIDSFKKDLENFTQFRIQKKIYKIPWNLY